MPARGTANHWAKLTPPDVLAIRKQYDEGIAAGTSVYAITKKIGAEYGLAPTTIYYVGIRRTWRDVEEKSETAEGSGDQ